jgi:hypothetical protein
VLASDAALFVPSLSTGVRAADVNKLFENYANASYK